MTVLFFWLSKKHLSDNWPLLEKETALIFFLAVKIFQLLTGGRHESPQQRNWNPNFFFLVLSNHPFELINFFKPI